MPSSEELLFIFPSLNCDRSGNKRETLDDSQLLTMS